MLTRCGLHSLHLQQSWPITTLSAYDAHGRPASITDANGLVTQLTYTPRGWLATRTVGGLLTQFTYDNVGQLTQVTLPDNSFIGYAYDAAHRLYQITNAAGDKLVYTLDLMGNRTKEEVFDAGNTVIQRKNRVFDTLSRLAPELNAANTAIASYTYDNNGNVKTQTQKYDASAANDAVTSYDYDPLNRLTKITNALVGLTQYGYNGADHLVSVTDPRTLVTSYAVDGLDNQKQLVSPDTGTTNSTFDAAGNLKTRTDARGKLSTYSCDALNRVTGVTFSDPTPAIAYLYDDIAVGNFGKGRLTKMTDATGNTEFKYDLQGRLIQTKQTTGSLIRTVSYGFDALGRLASTTYPSGKLIGYSYNSNGQITGMTVNGANAVTSITYRPFGPAQSWSFANGAAVARAFDLNGRLTAYPLGAASQGLGYDLSDRLTAFAGASVKTLGYDKLDRLTTFVNGTTTTSYNYDASGNRTRLQVGSAIGTYVVAAASNRLSSVIGANAISYGYDTAGNTVSNGVTTFAYDARGRLTSAAAVSYGVNGLGQRLSKAGTPIATGRHVYAYDQAGHLIGEYDTAGGLISEVVYLDDMPVLAIKATATYYVQTDQLDTPQSILNAANQVIWRWDVTEPFGNSLPNENPSGLGAFVFNLRHPGQFKDNETGLYQNGYRDYNPGRGRYFESDPIGLAGGINTYGYALGNPIKWTDSLGLDVFLCHRPADLPFPLNMFDHYWLKTDTLEAGMGGMRGAVPAQNGNSDKPYQPTQTVNHFGQSRAPNASCEKQNNVDERCVNSSISPGQTTGNWNPYN